MTIKFSVMRVSDVMTPHPVLISPDATLKEAAAKMASVDCGILPVGTEGGLKGMITDRDIVIRAIAEGKDPAHEKVADHMTAEIVSCREDDTLEDAAEKMHEHKVSRLIVTDKTGKVSGILSFGYIMRADARPAEIAAVIKHAAGPVSI